MRLVLRKTTTWLALVAALAAGYGFGNLHEGPLPLFGRMTNDTDEVVAAAEPETESPRSARAASEPDHEPIDSTPPPLAVTSPAEGAVFAEKTVRFEGETESGAVVSAGPYEADVNEDGRWTIVLVLAPGDNPVTFTATDVTGNAASATVTVTYDAPEPPTEKPAADEGDVCAKTTESCDHDTDGDVCADTTKDCDHDTDDDVCADTTETCHHDTDDDVCADTTETCHHDTDDDLCADTTKDCHHDSVGDGELKD